RPLHMRRVRMLRARGGRALLVAVLAAAGATPAAAGAPLSPRLANYRIEARYDAAAHRITAHEQLTWHNAAQEAAPDLYFHLYLNAFANDRSSFVRESGRAWL